MLPGCCHSLQVPRRKQGWGGEKLEVLLGPEVVCRCETDIYEAIGLAYVPSTMRFFCNFCRWVGGQLSAEGVALELKCVRERALEVLIDVLVRSVCFWVMSLAWIFVDSGTHTLAITFIYL